MSDCCASSSPRNKVAACTSAIPPSFAVRPGVTFPDWSAVTSPAVKDALLAMVGSDHMLNRWSGYDPAATDRVRTALLQFYAEHSRAPTKSTLATRTGLNETAITPLLEELRRRDLLVLDGDQIIGAHPFTDRDTGHQAGGTVIRQGRRKAVVLRGIGGPAHCPFRGLLGVHRVTACTLARSPIRDTLIEGFSHFVTSMTAPIASRWSDCRVGLAPTGKRRRCTAHIRSQTFARFRRTVT
jgi:hypothetical protein